MVLKYSRLTMCFASTFAVSSPALFVGCGDGVFTTVRGDSGAPDDGSASSADAATMVTRDAQQLDDAGMPYATGEATSLGGCVSLPRVKVCIPPGAVSKRVKISLHAHKNENIVTASEPGSPGMFVFRMEITPAALQMGDEYFPCVEFNYDGFDTNNVVPAQYFDRKTSRGWEPMLPFKCRSEENTIVGAIAESNERLASGIIITAAQSCNSGSSCTTKFCSAQVCQ